MFSLLREVPLRRLLLEQTPAFSVSFLIADSYYKLGSFGLELIAFLATWFTIDAVIQLGLRLVGTRKRSGA
jgi:hypothetical protein